MLTMAFWAASSLLSFRFGLAEGLPLSVQVPVEAFSRRPQQAEPLRGSLWKAERKSEATAGRAVLLVHMRDRSKEDWNALAPVLQEAGFDVLAIDLRDRGKRNQKTLIEDVQSGVVFLKTDPRVAALHVALVGASMGANGAAHYAGANTQMAHIIDALVLLSPGRSYEKLAVFDTLKSIVGIPVLLVATEGDGNSAETVRKGEKQCRTRCRAVVYPRGGHGTDMLKSERGEALKKALVDFLLRPYG